MDYMVKKLTSAQFFSLHAIQLNTFTWSEAVIKLKIFVNINLAIVATYVVFAQDMKNSKQPIFSIISYIFSM